MMTNVNWYFSMVPSEGFLYVTEIQGVNIKKTSLKCVVSHKDKSG